MTLSQKLSNTLNESRNCTFCEVLENTISGTQLLIQIYYVSNHFRVFSS